MTAGSIPMRNSGIPGTVGRETGRQARQRINAVVEWTAATDYGGDNACERRGPMSL